MNTKKKADAFFLRVPNPDKWKVSELEVVLNQHKNDNFPFKNAPP